MNRPWRAALLFSAVLGFQGTVRGESALDSLKEQGLADQLVAAFEFNDNLV